ncbi:hypothetical protein OF83DRAFT_1093694 [Amylostereum chailletii]|nr:hypothetical protein OF83DRAFT_1093694 [Amylostereum chailletii]
MTYSQIPEIARLQNSLQHLRKTQDEIRKFIEADRDPDPELVEAKQENETVMFV